MLLFLLTQHFFEVFFIFKSQYLEFLSMKHDKSYHFSIVLFEGYSKMCSKFCRNLDKKCWRQQKSEKIVIFRPLKAHISPPCCPNLKTNPIFHIYNSWGIFWYKKFWNLVTFKNHFCKGPPFELNFNDKTRLLKLLQHFRGGKQTFSDGLHP